LFLTGALRRPALAPVARFTIVPVSLAADVAPHGLAAADLLNRAIDRLDPAKVAWLRLKVWQRMCAGEIAFESEGTLQLGPKHCARLELAVHTGAVPGRWLVVSDGHALAHVVQLGDEKPTVASQLLDPLRQPDQPAPPPVDETLRGLGCGGPLPLLVDLRTRLRDLTAQTGRLHGRPTVRIHGRLQAASAAAPGTPTADFCYLYLEAPTLWPSRVEWWASGRKTPLHLLLEIEFRDAQLNHPLSLAECVRMFSYRPVEASHAR
jgi:hypothetical protein